MNGALQLLRAVGAPTSYAILKALQGGERCACELPSLIGKTQSNTSMHLAKLSKLGVVASRREGKKIIYRINDKRVLQVFKTLEAKA